MRGDRRKVAMVEGDDQVRGQPIGEDGERRVCASEWEVGVAFDESGDAGCIVSTRVEPATHPEGRTENGCPAQRRVTACGTPPLLAEPNT
jgi:hypothetical protein